MSSNHLSKSEEILFAELLNYKVQGDPLVQENLFTEEHLDTHTKSKWTKIKNRYVNVVKDYLGLRVLKNKPLWRDVVLLNFYAKNQLPKNYDSTLKRIFSTVEKEKGKSEWNELIKYKALEIEVEQSKDIRIVNQNLESMSASLDNFYFEQKFKILCEQVNRQFIVNSNVTQQRFLDTLSEEAIDRFNVRTTCYYLIYKLYTTQNHIYVDDLQNAILENSKELSPPFLATCFNYILNFHIRKLNAGHIEYATNYVDTIDVMGQYGLLLKNNTLSGSRFKNCIALALLANRSRWSKEFFEKYADHLNYKKEDILSFCKALILFHDGKNEECKEALIGFNPPDIYYKIAYDKLMLKIYYSEYMQGTYDVKYLRSLIQSSKKYINIQSKLNENRKSINLRFLSCLQDMISEKEVSLEALRGTISAIDYAWIKKEVLHNGEPL